MTREQIVETLMLLSALEAWSFAEKHQLPDHLLERLDALIDAYRKELLK